MNVLDKRGRPRIQCDKEVRARKGPTRWTGCKRKATVFVKSKYTFLDYCQRHAPKGGE